MKKVRIQALNSILTVEVRVVQKLNQTSYPEKGLLSFLGVLF